MHPDANAAGQMTFTSIIQATQLLIYQAFSIHYCQFNTHYYDIKYSIRESLLRKPGQTRAHFPPLPTPPIWPRALSRASATHHIIIDDDVWGIFNHV